jgi:ribonuclease HI
MNPEPDEDEIVVYTDGSATNNGREDVEAGAGIYYGPNDTRNRAIRVPNELQPSNNVGELIAIK